MSEQKSFPWLKNYPEGVPATIDPDIFPSLAAFEEHCAKEFGNLPAFTNFGSTLTYAEFDKKSTAFAAYLLSLPGIEKGDRVAIMMPNLLQYPVTFFGILKAGLVVVNVNPLYTARELESTLKDSGAKVLVIIENFARTYEKVASHYSVEHVITTQIGDLFAPLKRTFMNFMIKKVKKMVPPFNIPGAVPFNEALAKGEKLPFNPPEIVGSDPAFLQYTGGTTGVAKGAILTNRNIIANLQQTGVWVSRDFEKGKEVVMVALPLYHIFSLTALCFYLQWGAHCILITNRET